MKTPKNYGFVFITMTLFVVVFLSACSQKDTETNVQQLDSAKLEDINFSDPSGSPNETITAEKLQTQNAENNQTPVITDQERWLNQNLENRTRGFNQSMTEEQRLQRIAEATARVEKACISKSEGDSCSLEYSKGNRTGTCKAQDSKVICVPELTRPPQGQLVTDQVQPPISQGQP